VDSAIFLPSQRGVFFRHDGGSFVLTEDGTYELMRRIAPELTGRQSLEDICRYHEPTTRARVVWLVDRLIARGVLRNDRHPHLSRLPEAVRWRFAPQIALLDHLTDAPEERFARFRASQVLLVGSGLSFQHCATALVRSGLERLWLLDVDAAQASDRAVDVDAEGEAAALRALGIPAAIAGATVADDLSLARPDDVSLMLCVADAVSLPDLVTVGRWALRDSCPVIPAVIVGRQSLMGPTIHAPGCSACALGNLALALCDPSQRQRFRRAIRAGGGRLAPSAKPDRALARRLGGDVAFEAFKLLAGEVRPELNRGLLLQTADAAGGVQAEFVPYARHGCEQGACAGAPPRSDPPRPPAPFETEDPLFRPRADTSTC
jgi:hypothetical protein